MRAYKGGDPRRFIPLSADQQKLVESYYPYAVWMASQHIRPGESLDVLVASCCEGLVRAAQTWDESRATFKTYAYEHMFARMKANRYADRPRAMGKIYSGRGTPDRRPRSSPLCVSELPVPAREQNDSNGFSPDMREAMECLDGKALKLIELYFILGMTHEEVGEVFGFTRSRAQQLIERALCRLREVMGKRSSWV